jgi:hypothetical protein
MTLPLVAAIAFSTSTLSWEAGNCLNWEHEEPAYVAEAWQQETERQKRERERHEQDLKGDVELGKKVIPDVEKEFDPSTNKEFIERVERIGKELADIANSNVVKVSWGDPRLNKFEYTFKVVKPKVVPGQKDREPDEDQVNAFSLPGGFIYILEGLVKYSETDDELAGVIAHEISHASFRHIKTLEKESSKLQLIQLPALLVAIFSGGRAGGDLLMLSQLVGLSSTSGWSQQAELSADFGAIQYLQKSKYSPVGMLTFMERLARDQRALESIEWGIYRTHPPGKERAEAMQKQLVAAKIPIRRSQVSTSSRTVSVLKPDGNVEVAFGGKPIVTFAGQDAAARADEAAAKLNEFFDTVPEMFEVTATPDGAIVGRKEVLFRITASDAEAAKKPVSALSEAALKAVKRSLFALAYRIWETR